MKSYFLLLRLNLRNLLAGFRGAMRKPNGKIDISRLILYPLALLGMLTLAGFVIFMEFSMFSAFEMLNAPEMLPGLAILLAMVTALLFSVFQMLAALYFSRDTASMAYLPLTSRTVLAAKWTEVYVSELLFSLLIAAPAVVLYGIHYAADWTYYLRMVPVLLAVNCIPLTISLLLASILGRFTSLTRHKEVLFHGELFVIRKVKTEVVVHDIVYRVTERFCRGDLGSVGGDIRRAHHACDGQLAVTCDLKRR